MCASLTLAQKDGGVVSQLTGEEWAVALAQIGRRLEMAITDVRAGRTDPALGVLEEIEDQIIELLIKEKKG